MEAISYHAYSASSQLAQERGTYSSFKGCLWDQGILPLDTLNLLKDSAWRTSRSGSQQNTGLGSLENPNSAKACAIPMYGDCADRNHLQYLWRFRQYRTDYQNLYVKSNLSGEFTVVNNPSGQ